MVLKEIQNKFFQAIFTDNFKNLKVGKTNKAVIIIVKTFPNLILHPYKIVVTHGCNPFIFWRPKALSG